jgi:hypothetical protein
MLAARTIPVACDSLKARISSVDPVFDVLERADVAFSRAAMMAAKMKKQLGTRDAALVLSINR